MDEFRMEGPRYARTQVRNTFADVLYHHRFGLRNDMVWMSVGGAGGCGTLKCLSVWTDACNSRFPHMLPVRYVFKALSIYVH